MSMAFTALSRRREQERLLIERQSYLKDNFRADCAAKWEKRTSDKIEKRNILKTVQSLAEQDEQELEQKRNQLRKLYAAEMAEWQDMYEQLQSKLNEDREHQLRDKALKLKEKREQERREFVQACYDRQGKETFEEARAQSARHTMNSLTKDRKESYPLQQLKAREEEEKSELVQNSVRVQEEREAKDRLHRQMQNAEMRVALDEQISQLKLKSEIEFQTKMEEEKALLEQWKLEDSMSKKLNRDALELARANGGEILKANLDRSRKLNELKILEEERDKILLTYAMENEKREIENDKNRKQTLQDSCVEYISGLKEQTQQDREASELTEQMRMNAIEEVQRKRDNQMKLHSDDRKQKMLEINRSRIEQIKEKERLIKEEKANATKQYMENMTQLQRQLDSEEELRKKKQEMTYQTMLCNKELAQLRVDQKLKYKV